MRRRIQLAQRLFINLSLLACLSVTELPAAQWEIITRGRDLPPLAHPFLEGITGEILFSKLLEHNGLREAHLQEYSGPRTYKVENSKGKVRAESRVVLQYRAPSTKEYKIVSERGSGYVRNHVFKQLLESEIQTAAGRNRHDSSITPANYNFELLGEEDVDGNHCYVVQATPKRNDKYLLNGRIWIHAEEFAIVKIAGRPAKNPSFWIRRVDFVRRYQEVEGFWLPLRDESVTQVRLFGKNVLTIDYGNYEILRSEHVGTELIAGPEGERAGYKRS